MGSAVGVAETPKTHQEQTMTEGLREAVVEIIERECAARDSNGNIGDEVLGAEIAADAILEIPEIKEALAHKAAAKSALDAHGEITLSRRTPGNVWQPIIPE
jgi:hypothetical protein